MSNKTRFTNPLTALISAISKPFIIVYSDADLLETLDPYEIEMIADPNTGPGPGDPVVYALNREVTAQVKFMTNPMCSPPGKLHSISATRHAEGSEPGFTVTLVIDYPGDDYWLASDWSQLPEVDAHTAGLSYETLMCRALKLKEPDLSKGAHASFMTNLIYRAYGVPLPAGSDETPTSTEDVKAYVSEALQRFLEFRLTQAEYDQLRVLQDQLEEAPGSPAIMVIIRSALIVTARFH